MCTCTVLQYVHVYVHVYAHVYLHVYLHARACVYMRTSMCMHVCAYVVIPSKSNTSPLGSGVPVVFDVLVHAPTALRNSFGDVGVNTATFGTGIQAKATKKLLKFNMQVSSNKSTGRSASARTSCVSAQFAYTARSYHYSQGTSKTSLVLRAQPRRPPRPPPVTAFVSYS